MSRPTKMARTMEKLDDLVIKAAAITEIVKDMRVILETPIKPKSVVPIEEIVEPVTEPVVKEVKTKLVKDDPVYTCDCGKELTLSSRKRHEKSNAHLKFIKSSSEDTFSLDSLL